jgi:1-deoxy-D-xylulose-5-phosphate reductoisomerase
MTQAAQELRARLAADARGGAPATDRARGQRGARPGGSGPGRGCRDGGHRRRRRACPPTLAAANAGKRAPGQQGGAGHRRCPVHVDAVRDGGATAAAHRQRSTTPSSSACPSTTARVPALSGVDRILLTASGGPFRTWDAARIAAVTPEQACAHPNWSMGRKISVDSATLMNKGLELAEACWLFGVGPAEVIQVVVHPQSVIHSLVQYRDGSVLAQLGNPDMRTPIAYGLAWPSVAPPGVRRSTSSRPRAWISRRRTRGLSLPAYRPRGHCRRRHAMAVCNAANEVAVAGVPRRRASASWRSRRSSRQTLDRVSRVEPESLAVVEAADSEARHGGRRAHRARRPATTPLAQSER